MSEAFLDDRAQAPAEVQHGHTKCEDEEGDHVFHKCRVVHVIQAWVEEGLLKPLDLADCLARDEHVESGADQGDRHEQGGQHPRAGPLGEQQRDGDHAAEQDVHQPEHPPVRTGQDQGDLRSAGLGIPQNDRELGKLQEEVQGQAGQHDPAQDLDGRDRVGDASGGAGACKSPDDGSHDQECGRTRGHGRREE